MALLFPLKRFLRALGALGGSTNDLPLLLPIGRERSREELEHELCAARQLTRDKARLASEAFGVAAAMRAKLDQAEGRAAEAAAKLAAYDRTVSRLQKEIGWRRDANVRLAVQCREYRDALKQITDDLAEGVNVMRAERLELVPLADQACYAALPLRVGFVAKCGSGHLIGVALVSNSRTLLARVVEQLLPRIEDVKLVETKSEERGTKK